jgi:hypothetical protein
MAATESHLGEGRTRLVLIMCECRRVDAVVMDILPSVAHEWATCGFQMDRLVDAVYQNRDEEPVTVSQKETIEAWAPDVTAVTTAPAPELVSLGVGGHS